MFSNSEGSENTPVECVLNNEHILHAAEKCINKCRVAQWTEKNLDNFFSKLIAHKIIIHDTLLASEIRIRDKNESLTSFDIIKCLL